MAYARGVEHSHTHCWGTRRNYSPTSVKWIRESGAARLRRNEKPLAESLADFREETQRQANGRQREQQIPREACGGGSGEAKNPSPVSGASSSDLRGLFHPNASTLADHYCAVVAGMLNLREMRGRFLRCSPIIAVLSYPPLCKHKQRLKIASRRGGWASWRP